MKSSIRLQLIETRKIHYVTFSENSLAMRAACPLWMSSSGTRSATVDHDGPSVSAAVTEALSGYEMVSGGTGLGMLSGIEFTAPRQIRMKLPFEAFRAIHPGMFGQTVVMRLVRDKGILTQMCGNNSWC